MAYLDTALHKAQGQLDAVWAKRWQRQATAAAAEHKTRTVPAKRDEEHVARTAQRERAVADATALLRAAAPRCDPSEVDTLTGRLAAMSSLADVGDVRSAALDLAVAVRDAVTQQKQRAAGDEHRARLLTLLDDALPEDQQRLRPALTNEQDPQALAAEVHQAVERADRRRHRDLVAKAAARALADAGCAVDEDFCELLLADEEAVVALGEPAGDYGLLVRLPTDGTRLFTAVIRPNDRDADPTLDTAAQQAVCDTTLPDFLASLGRNGISVDPQPLRIVAPGQLPVAAVAADRLQRAARNKSRRASTTQALRERRR